MKRKYRPGKPLVRRPTDDKDQPPKGRQKMQLARFIREEAE